jgi:hypothetical protein
MQVRYGGASRKAKLVFILIALFGILGAASAQSVTPNFVECSLTTQWLPVGSCAASHARHRGVNG